MKTEPETFSYDDLVKDGKTTWDGVRNYAARNHMKTMELDDLVLFYHSMSDKAIVGTAKVSKTHFPDPTDDTGTWASVEVIPLKPFKNPVTFETSKGGWCIGRVTSHYSFRLSVMPVDKAHYDHILNLSKILRFVEVWSRFS